MRGCLELVRVDPTHSIIQDHGFATSDARSLVACVVDRPSGELEVIWLYPEAPFPSRYRDALHVLTDLRRWRNEQRRHPQLAKDIRPDAFTEGGSTHAPATAL